jgi:hypothetical protein
MKEQYEYKDIPNLIENKKWFSVIKAYFELSFSFNRCLYHHSLKV